MLMHLSLPPTGRRLPFTDQRIGKGKRNLQQVQNEVASRPA